MIFCRECGNRIIEIIIEKGKPFGVCVNKHKTPLECSEIQSYYKIKTRKEEESGIIVKEKNQEDNGSAGVSIPCPKCGARKCILIYSYASRGDEEDTNIFECLACGHRFRLGYES